jgi:aspartyl-tRNA synthetase
MKELELLLLVTMPMFDHLNDRCTKELEAIQRRYPFEPLKASNKACVSSDAG